MRNVSEALSDKSNIESQIQNTELLAQQKKSEISEPIDLIAAEMLQRGAQNLGSKVVQKIADKTGSNTLKGIADGIKSGKGLQEIGEQASNDAINEVGTRVGNKVSELINDTNNAQGKVGDLVKNVQDIRDNSLSLRSNFDTSMAKQEPIQMRDINANDFSSDLTLDEQRVAVRQALNQNLGGSNTSSAFDQLTSDISKSGGMPNGAQDALIPVSRSIEQKSSEGVASNYSDLETPVKSKGGSAENVFAKINTSVKKRLNTYNDIATRKAKIRNSKVQEMQGKASDIDPETGLDKIQSEFVDPVTNQPILQAPEIQPEFSQVLDDNGIPIPEEGERIANLPETLAETHQRIADEANVELKRNIHMEGENVFKKPEGISQEDHQKLISQKEGVSDIKGPQPRSINEIPTEDNLIRPSEQTGGIDPVTLPENAGFQRGEMNIRAQRPSSDVLKPDAKVQTNSTEPIVDPANQPGKLKEPVQEIDPDLAPIGSTPTNNFSRTINNPAFDPNIENNPITPKSTPTPTPDNEQSFDQAISESQSDKNIAQSDKSSIDDGNGNGDNEDDNIKDDAIKGDTDADVGLTDIGLSDIAGPLVGIGLLLLPQILPELMGSSTSLPLSYSSPSAQFGSS
jgi:hypothetical protein